MNEQITGIGYVGMGNALHALVGPTGERRAVCGQVSARDGRPSVGLAVKVREYDPDRDPAQQIGCRSCYKEVTK